MSNPNVLLDGTAPATPQSIIETLTAVGIASHTHSHAPVFTVEQAKILRGELPGAHIKNLFLRNKRGRMWILTCLEDRTLDLKQLGTRLGSGRLSFGSPQRLMSYLGVIPGAVTPLAVINDRSGAVVVVLDRALVEAATINVHPLTNSRTTALTPAGLLAFLNAVDHAPTIMDFDVDG
jgi:Ala-tRNA(Pro) deacylase